MSVAGCGEMYFDLSVLIIGSRITLEKNLRRSLFLGCVRRLFVVVVAAWCEALHAPAITALHIYVCTIGAGNIFSKTLWKKMGDNYYFICFSWVVLISFRPKRLSKWFFYHFKRKYSEILISGSLDKWNRHLSGSKEWEPKQFFPFLTNTVQWIRWLNGSKFKFPK